MRRLRLARALAPVACVVAAVPLSFAPAPQLAAKQLPPPTAQLPAIAPASTLTQAQMVTDQRPRPAATVDVPRHHAAPFKIGPLTQATIPSRVLAAYVAAADKEDAASPGCRLPWSILAGIGYVESGNAAGSGGGRPGWNGIANPPVFGPALDGTGGLPAMPNTYPALDGPGRWTRAVGPMQFLPGSWLEYAAPLSGRGTANPQDIGDAAYTAARYLCANGTNLTDPNELSAAIFAYNHADWYVQEVLAYAKAFALGENPADVASQANLVPAPALLGVPLRPTVGRTAAQVAVIFAYAKLGTPYVWGGTGPEFDCSGLVQAAYAKARVELPRTSEGQWLAEPRASGALQPGDLVFFDPGEFLAGLPGHVGIYIGNGYMIDAPHTGAVVRIEPVGTFGAYMGAARPTGSGAPHVAAMISMARHNTATHPHAKTATKASHVAPAASPSPTPNVSGAPAPSPSSDPATSASSTDSPSASPSPSVSVSPSASPSPSVSPSPSSSASGSPSPSPSSSPASAAPAYQLSVAGGTPITLVPVAPDAAVPAGAAAIEVPTGKVTVIEVGADGPAALTALSDSTGTVLRLVVDGKATAYHVVGDAPAVSAAAGDLVLKWTEPSGKSVKVVAAP